MKGIRAADPVARLGEAVARGLFVVASRRDPDSLAGALRREGAHCAPCISGPRPGGAPPAAARRLASLADGLDGGGCGVMTGKRHENRCRRQLRAAMEALEPVFEVVGWRQLYHNRSEATVAVVRR